VETLPRTCAISSQRKNPEFLAIGPTPKTDRSPAGERCLDLFPAGIKIGLEFGAPSSCAPPLSRPFELPAQRHRERREFDMDVRQRVLPG